MAADKVHRTPQDWATALNEITTHRATQYGVDQHSAACHIIDWSVIDGTLAGIRYADSTDCLASGEMTRYEFISADGDWFISWDNKTLTWKGRSRD